MTVHELKIQPEYFREVFLGNKTFEIRKNDRGFHVGDTLILKEFSPENRFYTGRALARKITYMTEFQQKTGYVVLAIN
ncbi:ASCH/PUA domain-containing protein [Levilactobacillus enshiensis]|uniref:ASCH/PUA domain-containing protein n=1 Tax=Levilactobacillus enshiensis TaxID=2590213 RepID=UPI001CDD873A|nr:ASCH/PUA domain-containing protein [Levilactobacillus enshiensis]